MSNLRSTIENLSSQFAASVIEALRGASIDELYAVAHGGVPRRSRGRIETAVAIGGPRKRGRGGRLARRSAGDIGKMVDSIVDLLGRHPEGLRAEQIRQTLGCEAKELPRPLADAVTSGRVTKTGQKRATTYFAGASGASAARRRGRRSK